VARLPPKEQGTILLEHFVDTLHANFEVLHVPSIRNMLQKIYWNLGRKQLPSMVDLLLLSSIFAGSMLATTSEILERLDSTKEDSTRDFSTYCRLAMSVLDNLDHPLPLSTTALTGAATLAFVLSNSEGPSTRLIGLRSRCLAMARAMQIHRLDTARSREERRQKGCDMIEIEVQRRLWWHMVATDWSVLIFMHHIYLLISPFRLSAFSGGPHEAVYMLHPKHMNVNLPANVDNESITSTAISQEPSLSTPTAMSAFIQRVKLSEVCREIVDTLPSTLLDEPDPPYEAILAMDEKLQSYLRQLPVFFRLDSTSVRESEEVIKQRPHIIWQRLTIHFSLYSRLCRLHRPYHLEGSTNPKYAHSRTTCIRSAQKVLEIRSALDDAATPLKFTYSWIIMQHVYMAALTLATDVSFNPDAPDAEARKSKVMGAYDSLEKSKGESKYLVERIQKNMQNIIETLQKSRLEVQNSQIDGYESNVGRGLDEPNPSISAGESIMEGNDSTIAYNSTMKMNGLGSVEEATKATGAMSKEDLDQLWSDFLAAAPGLSSNQWTSLLDDMDFEFDSGPL
jgi:hypothetical protein